MNAYCPLCESTVDETTIDRHTRHAPVVVFRDGLDLDTALVGLVVMLAGVQPDILDLDDLPHIGRVVHRG